MRPTLLALFVFAGGLCTTQLNATPFYFYANLINPFGGGIPGSGQAEVDLSSDQSTINVYLEVNLNSAVVTNGTGIYDSGGNELYPLQVPFGVSSGLLTGTFGISSNDVSSLFAGNLYFDVLVQTNFDQSLSHSQAPVIFPSGQGAGGQLVQVAGPVLSTPEPASAGMIGLALAGLAIARRRASPAKAKPSA